MYEAVAAGLLMLISAAHSILGEKEILRPLFDDGRWSTPTPRWVHQRILRFAWHLTSVAWIGLALLILGIDGQAIAVGVGLATAIIIAVSLPGHFAWPVFAAVAWMVAASANMIPLPLLRALALSGAAAATAIGGLHFYWAAGGRRWADAVVPERAGERTFEPGPVATVLVGLCLLGFAALLVFGSVFTGGTTRPPAWVTWATAFAAVILGLRAVGDGRYAGFTKTERSTRFARRDDVVYTPAAVALAASAVAALAV